MLKHHRHNKNQHQASQGWCKSQTLDSFTLLRCKWRKLPVAVIASEASDQTNLQKQHFLRTRRLKLEPSFYLSTGVKMQFAVYIRIALSARRQPLNHGALLANHLGNLHMYEILRNVFL